HHDATTQVMRRRGNGDVITAQIYPYGEALGVDIGKMSQYICFLPMGNIKQDKLISGFFHFRIYRPGNDIPRCQPCTPVIFVHALATLLPSESPTGPANRFRNQERWIFAWTVPCRGVELHKLHIPPLTPGPIHPANTAARCNNTICC